MNKKQLSPRDRNVILIIVGLVIFLAAYFLGFQKFSDKNDLLDEEIVTQNEYRMELEGYYKNSAKYEKVIKDAKQNIELNLNRLPGGIEDEDFLVYLMDLAKTTKSELTSVEFLGSTLVSEFETVIDGKKDPVAGLTSTTVSTYVMNYEQLKQSLDYIYEETQKYTYVDGVTVTYNSENGLLEVIMTVSKLYVAGEDITYEPSQMPAVKQGVKDPFRTAGGSASTTAPATTKAANP